MADSNSLQRFIDAQETDYAIALSEIKKGRKQSHWMWYIFPQLQGLGFSTTSKFYAIQDTKEAHLFLEHPILGSRIREISSELLKLSSSNPTSVFGSPDDMKLKSSMTLFATLPSSDPVFQHVLDKFFEGQKDEMTIKKINNRL